jgi:hypothetical protein
MSRLERRIAKLVASLEHTELVLDRVAKAGNEAGRASGHREVEGLDPGAPEVEIRRGMLAQIFRANVELKDRVELQDQVEAGKTAASAGSVVKEHGSAVNEHGSAVNEHSSMNGLH